MPGQVQKDLEKLAEYQQILSSQKANKISKDARRRMTFMPLAEDLSSLQIGNKEAPKEEMHSNFVNLDPKYAFKQEKRN
jgi:hypothetical protein